MTMADQIAVMNAGRIEQLGAPTELYENPLTTFVANFLGRSNLIDGTITGRSGGDALVESHGVRLALPIDRVHADGDQVHVGVRPEKISISMAGEGGASEGMNSLEAVVTDASFIGVSTEYLARLPWGQEVAVFAQNMRRDERVVPGAQVTLSWDPAHTFALNADEAIDGGLEAVS